MSSIKIKRRLKSLIVFNKKSAIRFSNLDYYRAQSKNMKSYVFLESEKRRLSTPRWEKVTEIIESYKDKGSTTQSKIGRILIGMYNRNVEAAKRGLTPVKHSKLLQLVAMPEMLLLAYRFIRGNRGALTRGGLKTKDHLGLMTPLQKRVYFKSNIFPDGFSMKHVYLVSTLLRYGKYPWGVSKRVYFDKPGDPKKKRPITIPPFLDRVVQKAIDMVMHAMYEPYFERRNRSFGFRPNKSCHDAIVALNSWQNNGMRIAIEGDIQGAYDNVNKETLLKLISKRVSDRRFIEMISARLDYEYVESLTGKRERPTLGIPQGGIDSPYLFNIYLSELDEYVHTEVQSYIDRLNASQGLTPGNRARSRAYNSLISAEKKEIRNQGKIISEISRQPGAETLERLRKKLYKSAADKRRLGHLKRHMISTERNRQFLRIFYVRYADDWIVLTNADQQIAQHIKFMISNLLSTKLGATLSDKKTLITDITREPAHFLGFEVRSLGRGRLLANPGGIGARRSTGQGILLGPDRQRLISRLHMKGFCDQSGFPISMPWLSTLEPYTIIERYNACIRGMVQYYADLVPDSTLNRWIYILRYSCLKTLAQKYRCSIKKIFARFGVDQSDRSTATVAVKVRLAINVSGYDAVFYKSWQLLTYQEVISLAKAGNRIRDVAEAFNSREKGYIGEYPMKPGKLPAISNEGYLDAITWVQARTEASLDMPCSVCGSFDDVEMHHIKHVRKQAYALIPRNMTWKQVLALRNRKQIPVCKCCHDNIHAGKYKGDRLVSLVAPKQLVDNRTVHVESFVKLGREYTSKDLEDRGWKLENRL
jgi:retron-type reverse transcriptase